METIAKALDFGPGFGVACMICDAPPREGEDLIVFNRCKAVHDSKSNADYLGEIEGETEPGTKAWWTHSKCLLESFRSFREGAWE